MTVENEAKSTTEQIEKEARTFGWVPREEFRGSDSEWADAESFVKRGKEINPILRKNNELLLKKLDQATLEMAEVKKAAKEFEKFQREAADRKVKEITNQLEELKQARKEAITANDGDSVVAIEDQIDTLKADKVAAQQEAKEPVKEEPKQSEQVLDPLVVTWMDENPWFGADRRMTVMADEIGKELNLKSPHLRGKDFFDALNEELKEVFPEKLGKKERPNPVEGNSRGSSRPSTGGAQSYKNLPSDAKQACDRFVKQGLMTQEQYVKDFEWN